MLNMHAKSHMHAMDGQSRCCRTVGADTLPIEPIELSWLVLCHGARLRIYHVRNPADEGPHLARLASSSWMTGCPESPIRPLLLNTRSCWLAVSRMPSCIMAMPVPRSSTLMSPLLNFILQRHLAVRDPRDGRAWRSGSRIDMEIPNTQDDFLGLS